MDHEIDRPSTRRERRLVKRESRRGAPRSRRGVPRRGLGLGTLSALAIVGGIVVVAIALALGLTPKTDTGAGAGQAVVVERAPSGVPTDGFVLGKADAPVTIDLYEDFQCPACASWGRGVLPSLVANEITDGTAKVVFHDVAFLGPESVAAGHAAYAAAQQGHFWDMWATLYASQGQRENAGAFSRDRLLAMASGLGLDVAKFTADMDGADARAYLDASIAGARAVGITSTPSIVVAGQTYVGIGTYPALAAVVAAAR